MTSVGSNGAWDRERTVAGSARWRLSQQHASGENRVCGRRPVGLGNLANLQHSGGFAGQLQVVPRQMAKTYGQLIAPSPSSIGPLAGRFGLVPLVSKGRIAAEGVTT